jgi:hypothetical protein
LGVTRLSRAAITIQIQPGRHPRVRTQCKTIRKLIPKHFRKRGKRRPIQIIVKIGQKQHIGRVTINDSMHCGNLGIFAF